ncbi:MAG: hypothetical protein ACU843_15550 [Gammaproteobacteria bacterium]
MTRLAGKWIRVYSGECGQYYPAEIVFHEGSWFVAKKGRNQKFILWDAGTYAISGLREVKIQIATDEQVSYEFSLSGDVLTFVDSEGCKFTYHRDDDTQRMQATNGA